MIHFICIHLMLYIFSNIYASDSREPAPAQLSQWKQDAIGAIYNAATKTVAYGKKDKADYYKIFLSDSSGRNERAVTHPSWPADRHQWAEEWHPSGEYLFCYVEKEEYVKEKGHKRKPVDATPGYGAYTDLWIMTRDGSKAWKLLDLPNSYSSGIIHGAISEDGTVFAWSERVAAPNFLSLNLMAGAYVMRVADVMLTPTPRLENIRTFQPGDVLAANELESISNDKSELAFYSTFETKNLLATPIYIMNMQSGKVTRLTTESFAQAPTFSPDGKHIVYMTGAKCDIFPFEIQGADWWIMKKDGSDKRRLTFMNKWNHPHSVNHYRLAGSISFITNHSFYGGVMTHPFGLTGYTAKVSFKEE